MSEKIEIVGLVGEELMSSTAGRGAREAVLALPLGRLLLRMVRVPADQTDLAAYLTPLLQEASPYPDEPLTVGWEVVREDERGKVVLAGALPESSAEDIAEKMDAEKLRVTRLDALLLGELRALWPSLSAAGDLGSERRLLLIAEGAPEDRRTTGAEGAPEDRCTTRAEGAPEDRRTTGAEGAPEDRRTTGAEGAPEDRRTTGEPVLRVSSRAAIEMIVLDGDMPSAVRYVPAGANLRREAMLGLLEAENFGGARTLAEVITVGETDAAALASFAPVRAVGPVSVQDALEAIAARSEDPAALDLRPASWREYLDETRFKAKLAKGVAAAVGVWALAMGVLFGVPMAYGYMTDYQKGLSKQHQRAYKDVCSMKDKVLLVRKYSDHARGALEMIKAVSDRLPGDVELDSLDFKREDGITFSGVADGTESVYALKDALTELADGDENRIFGTVRLGRLSASKGKQRFTLDCRYAAEEENE